MQPAWAFASSVAGQAIAILTAFGLKNSPEFLFALQPAGRFFTPAPLALSDLAIYAARIVKQPFINVEEKIDRFVGKRTGTPDSFRTAMQLQEAAVQLHKTFQHRWAPKGVYRFKTHEEADKWMAKMLARSSLRKT